MDRLSFALMPPSSLTPLRACTVSFVAPTGVRHAVEVTADSLYEAAMLGVSLLRESGWAEQIASGAQLEIEVRQPATTHCVTVAQLRRWCEGIAVSPEETLRKRRLKALLA
jgi:hypothetical protein